MATGQLKRDVLLTYCRENVCFPHGFGTPPSPLKLSGRHVIHLQELFHIFDRMTAAGRNRHTELAKKKFVKDLSRDMAGISHVF